MTAPAIASATTGVPIRVLPVPDWRPALIDPADLDLADPVGRTENLAFDLVYPPARPDRKPQTRGHAAGTAAEPWDDEDPVTDWVRPDPSLWAGRMGVALVEVATGSRPSSQVIRWTSPAVYETVVRRRASCLRSGVTRRPPLALRGVAVCQPRTGIVEASVLVAETRRVHAVALRLRGRQRRWLVDALEFG